MNQPVLQDILPIVRSAGEIMLRREGASSIQTKAAQDFVTEVDFRVQSYICAQLKSNWPDIQFMGEEKDNSDIDFSKPCWVLDPIDGTTNFIRKIPPYSISIAYMKDGQPRAAAVYAPLTNEMFSAYEGGGAFLNGEPIHVSGTTDPQECILGMSFAHRHPVDSKLMFELIPRISKKINDMRRLGSAAYDLCCVACGRYDAFIERKLYIYDIAAGVLIAREAGAVTCGWPDGGDCLLTGDTIAVTPGIADWLKGELA